MRMNILYVDDELDLLELATVFFSDEGLVLDTAREFEVAWNLILQKKYDLIIADIRMPTGSGVELVQRARNEGKFDGKFILVSGDISSRLQAKASGCDLMMNKPLDFFALAESVKNLLNFK